MITEDYISFETAKFLIDKGFDGDIDLWFDENGVTFFEVNYNIMNDWRIRGGHKIYPRPTLQMAMKWLREKYNLEIYPYHDSLKQPYKWWFEIIKYPNSAAEYESWKDEEFDTYEETCENAIRYCLENLI